MPYRGKIASHFPGLGNPNRDVIDARFIPKGGTGNDAQRIAKVYRIPHGFNGTISANNIEDFLVWEWVTYVAGTQNVAIPFTPTHDVTVSSVGIFTNDNDTSSSCIVHIYHSSGLLIAAANVDVLESVSTGIPYEKYGMTGYIRTATLNSPVTFKANNTYYIAYKGRTNNQFYPVYMQGKAGRYKEYNSQDANPTVATSYNNDCGENNITAFFGGSEDDFMLYTDQTENYGNVFNNNRIYFRSSTSAPGTYYGKVTDNSMTSACDTCFQIPVGQFFYMKSFGDQSQGVSNSKFYQRTNTLPPSDYAGIKDNKGGGIGLAVGKYFIDGQYNKVYKVATAVSNYVGEKSGTLNSVYSMSSAGTFKWTGNNVNDPDHALTIEYGKYYSYSPVLSAYQGVISEFDDGLLCNAGDTFMTDNANWQLSQERLYRKNRASIVEYMFPTNVSYPNDVYKVAQLLMDISNDPNGYKVLGPETWNTSSWGSNMGECTIKSSLNATVQIASLTPESGYPSNPVPGGLYFIKSGDVYYISQSVNGNWADLINSYYVNWGDVFDFGNIIGDSSKIFSVVPRTDNLTYVDIDQCFTEVTLGSTLNDVTSTVSGLIKSSQYSNFAQTTTYTDKRFYLRINGKEV